MTATALQRPLPGLRVKVHLPTTDFIGARGMLRTARYTEEIRAMIDDSLRPDHLTWAWNIATRGTQREEVRILVASIEAVQRGERFEASLDEVARILAGHLIQRGQPPAFIRGKDFSRIFICKPEHVSHLLEDGILKRLPKTDWRRGPGGSAVIGWDQFLAFLDERRLAR